MIQEHPQLIVDARRPGWPCPAGERQLQFHVLYTSLKATAPALRRAAELASELSGRLTILAALTVPYPLPLTEPPVPVDFLERTLWTLALGIEADTTVQIYLCRDARQTFRQMLPAHSTVMIGDPRPRWWPARERRIAQALRADGHAVFLIDPASL